jgi:hypothetical protein
MVLIYCIFTVKFVTGLNIYSKRERVKFVTGLNIYSKRERESPFCDVFLNILFKYIVLLFS